MSERQRAGTILVASAVALIAAGAALFLFHFRPALLLLSTTARSAAAAAVIVLAAIAAGLAAIRFARRAFGGDDERVPLTDALLIGFVVLGTLLGLIAWIGVALDLIVAVVTLLLGAAGAIAVWRQRALIRLPRISFLVAVPLLFAAVEAVTPVNSPDELIYKLGVVRNYQLYGRMVELPLNSNSYLAMGLQLGDLGALVISGGIAAKLVHFALFVAALLVIRRLAARLTPHRGFVVAVVAWTPALMIIAGWCWTEWPLLGLLVLSFERYQRWLDERKPLHAAIAFAALGAGAACKYTALPWLLAAAIVIGWRHRAERRLLITAAMLVFAFGAFFYVRNAVWTGSPVAPLLLPDPPGFSHFQGHGGWWDLFHGTWIFNAAVADESAGIVLPVMAILGLAAFARRDRQLRDLAWIGVLQLPVLIAFAPGPRNVLCALVPLAIAGAAIAGRNAIVTAAACVGFCAQAVLVMFVLDAFDVGPYLAGSETPRGYIARVREFAKPYAFIAAESPPRSRVLLLAENRTYYLDRECISGGNLDGPRIANWIARFPTPDVLIAEWRRIGITHVLLHTRWYRVSSRSLQPLQPVEREYVLQVTPQIDALLTTTLKSRAILRYRDDAYLVFELR
jgi:hypothetical protein